MIRIGFVTGARSEYGIMKRVITELKTDPLFDVKIVAYSGDSRSPIPMISVHSVGDLLYRRQS